MPKLKDSEKYTLNKQKLIEQKQIYLGLESAAKSIRERLAGLEVLRKSIISFEQWLIIEQIGKHPGVNQSLIIEKLSKEPASISRMVRKLIEKEMIYKQKKEDDKKIGQLFLTNKGDRLYRDAKKIVDREFREIFSSFYERELNLLIDILKRI